MEMIFATVIGCVLSFVTGAYVAYFMDYVRKEKPAEVKEEQMDPEIKRQWESFLMYDGER